MLNTVFPKIHKEGYKFLAISIIVTFLVLFFSQTLGLILILIVGLQLIIGGLVDLEILKINEEFIKYF